MTFLGRIQLQCLAQSRLYQDVDFNVEPSIIYFNCWLCVLILTVPWDIHKAVKLFVFLDKQALTFQTPGISAMLDIDTLTAMLSKMKVHFKNLMYRVV